MRLADLKIDGEKLKAFRQQRKSEAAAAGVEPINAGNEPFSQRDLADRVDLSYISIYRIERGTRGAALATIDRLAGALGVDVAKLLVGGDDG